MQTSARGAISAMFEVNSHVSVLEGEVEGVMTEWVKHQQICPAMPIEEKTFNQEIIHTSAS